MADGMQFDHYIGHSKYINMKTIIFTKVLSLIFILTVSSASAEDRIEKKYTIDDFSRIYLRGPYEVHLRQGASCGLSIEAKESYFEKLEVNSSGGELSIELDGKNFRTSKNIVVYINFKDLQKLEIEGAVDLQCENQIRTTNLKLEFEGAGNVELDVEADKIIAEIAGVGNFEIEGSTEYHKVEFDGIGSYDAHRLRSKYTIVESNGIGSVSVYASNKFKGNASGIGSVDYYGDPDDVSVNASGLGSVNRH
jgi:hypothetical protein